MPERSKRHHYVPQLHLRAFATDDERLATVDRREHRTWVQSVEKAAAENDYNTIRDADGQPSDEIENRISELEALWAGALISARNGDLLTQPETKDHLAFFIAFQYLRVPRQRSLNSQLEDLIGKLEIAAGGPSRIRSAMEATGLRPTDAEVLAEWERHKDFEAFEFRPTTEGHLASQFGMLEALAARLIAGYQWSVWRWERCRLLTSDHPVILEPASDHPEWSGIGFSTAGAIHLAVARDTALVLVNRSDLTEAGHPDPQDIANTAGSFNAARSLNWNTAAQASRYVYHHPDDSMDGLVGTAQELPAPRDELIAPDTGADLLANLVSAGEWAFAHPGAPHPMRGLGEIPGPPPEARTPVVDGRARRIQAMKDRLENS